MADYSPPGRPEAIPAEFASVLAAVNAQQLAALAAATTTRLASGQSEPEVVHQLIQAGWNPRFVQWFADVYGARGPRRYYASGRPTADNHADNHADRAHCARDGQLVRPASSIL